jgi:HlyD family secretion protein
MRLLPAVIFVSALSCSSGKSPLKFETLAVDRGTITSKVTATGTLSALVTVQIGSQVSGRIAELHVDFNDTVKKGQVLARLDPQLYNAALDQARANSLATEGQLKKARVQAADAQRQAERSKSLLERALIAQADFDTAQALADAAAAQVSAATGTLEQARAALRQAEINLAFTTITSPISGVVISRNVELGQTVAASLSAPVLFVLAEDLTHMQVDTAVSEADVGMLAAGMTASFRVDAYPGQRFAGKLRQVRNSPQVVQNVVTYDAVLDVDNEKLLLKPGMTANVTFIAAQRDDVLRVPNAALRFRPASELMPPTETSKPVVRKDGPSDRRTLWRLAPGNPRPEPVPIRIGLTDGSFTEVVEGPLAPGDSVVTDASGGKAERGSNPLAPNGGGGTGRRVF